MGESVDPGHAFWLYVAESALLQIPEAHRKEAIALAVTSLYVSNCRRVCRTARCSMCPIPVMRWQMVGGDAILIGWNEATEQVSHGIIEARLGITASSFLGHNPEAWRIFQATMATGECQSGKILHRMNTTGELRVVTYMLERRGNFIVLHFLDTEWAFESLEISTDRVRLIE